MKKLFDFLLLGFLIFAMFTLGVFSSNAVIDILTYMNNPQELKTNSDWLVFGISSIIATYFWTALWLWFKTTEKRCIEYMEKKNSIVI